MCVHATPAAMLKRHFLGGKIAALLLGPGARLPNSDWICIVVRYH